MVGFDNYRRMLDDEIFWKSLQHSLLFALLLPLVTHRPRAVLRLHDQCRRAAPEGRPVIAGVRGSSFYKIVYFFPQVLSIAIVALLFAVRVQPGRAARSTALLRGDRPRQRPAATGWATPTSPCGACMAVLVWCHGRLLRRPVLRRHGVHPEGHLRGGAARRRGPRPRPSSGSPCRCCGTPCSPAGSTWASSPWARSRSRSCRS